MNGIERMEAGGRMWIPEAIEFHERQRCNAAAEGGAAIIPKLCFPVVRNSAVIPARNSFFIAIAYSFS